MAKTVHHVGIIMNGVTGRMGTNQHLVRSILAIRDSGGVRLEGGGTIFAPTPQESVGAAAFTAPAQPGGQSLTIEGSTWTLNALGLSKEEVLDVIAETEARQNRNASAAALGLEA